MIAWVALLANPCQAGGFVSIGAGSRGFAGQDMLKSGGAMRVAAGYAPTPAMGFGASLGMSLHNATPFELTVGLPPDQRIAGDAQLLLVAGVVRSTFADFDGLRLGAHADVGLAHRATKIEPNAYKTVQQEFDLAGIHQTERGAFVSAAFEVQIPVGREGPALWLAPVAEYHVMRGVGVGLGYQVGASTPF